MNKSLGILKGLGAFNCLDVEYIAISTTIEGNKNSRTQKRTTAVRRAKLACKPPSNYYLQTKENGKYYA